MNPNDLNKAIEQRLKTAKNSSSISLFKYLGIIYFFLAFLFIYLTTDLYWIPEGGSSGFERDWGPYPTGMMFLSPLLTFWGLISFKLKAFETDLPQSIEHTGFRKSGMIVLILTCFLLLLVGLTTAQLLTTISLFDIVKQRSFYQILLICYIVFNFISALILFILDILPKTHYSSLIQAFSKKDMKFLLIFISIITPTLFSLIALELISSTSIEYQFLTILDSNTENLYFVSTFPLISGIFAFFEGIFEPFPLFFPFFILFIGLALIELLLYRLTKKLKTLA